MAAQTLTRQVGDRQIAFLADNACGPADLKSDRTRVAVSMWSRGARAGENLGL